MKNAAKEPNPTREFMFGDPFLKAPRPSKSRSASYHSISISGLCSSIISHYLSDYYDLRMRYRDK